QAKKYSKLERFATSTVLTGAPAGQVDNDVASFTALSSLSVVCSYADRSFVATAVVPMAQQYHWDQSFVGVVLGAFFLGYALTQALGGWMADRYGGRMVLCWALVAWSVCTLLTPAAARNPGTLLAVRVGLGLGEGLSFPAIHSMISEFVPSDRQATVVGIVTAASYAGAAIAFAAAPAIIAATGSWEQVFYTFGGASCFLAPAWLLYRPVPLKLPGTALPNGGFNGTPSGDEGNGGDTPKTAASAPSDLWPALRRLTARREIQAIMVAQFTQSVGMYGLLNWLPTYLHDRFGVAVEDLALLTVAPYLLQAVVGIGAGALADWLVAAPQRWRVKTVRRVLQAAGMLGPAAFSALAAWRADSAETGAALLAVGSGLSALTLGAVSVNHLDVAPRSAGLSFGVGNTAATLAGLLTVPASGWLLERSGGSWELLFAAFAFSYVAGCGVWLAWVGDTDIEADEANNS
ncbi:unnamed protein product, partial [Phaeothamnion confervicola]